MSKKQQEEKLICKRCGASVWITLSKEQREEQECLNCGSTGRWRKENVGTK